MSDISYKDQLRKMIEGKTKEEAIAKVKYIMFLIEQDNYIDQKKYYACECLLEELEEK